jgi:sodium-dependent dicarboxylate transporter 2/3/5
MISMGKVQILPSMKTALLFSRSLAAAGLAFFLATLFTPAPQGLTEAGWHTLGAAAMMGAFWISEILPFPVTALLPLVVFPATGICSVSSAAAPFSNSVIYLFLGGIFIALAMETSNLHSRIALRIIRLAGIGRRAVIGGFLMASFFISMWVNNTAVAVMMLPIALSVLSMFKQDEDREFAPALVLSVAYGATIGGMSTLVGTPPNAILAGFLRENYDIRVGFLGWMILALPVSLFLAGAAWLMLTRVAHRLSGEDLPGGHEILRRAEEDLGPMSWREKMVAAVFFTTAGLWVARGFLEDWLPWLNDSTIAMAGGLSLFMLPARRGSSEPILTWKECQRVPWDILVLIGGGLSLAAAIQKNGVADWIGQVLAAADRLPTAGLLFLLIFLVIWLSELASNSATTLTFLPIVAALAVALGQPLIYLGAAVALGSTCGFMLPVSSPPNAIVFGSGRVTIPQMARAGFWMNILGWVMLASWLAWVAPKLPWLAD